MDIRKIREVIIQAVKPLRNIIYTYVNRGVVDATDDSMKMQLSKLKIFANEVREKIERFQNFGFSSTPPMGSECIVVSLGGNRDNLVVIVADDRRVRIKDLPEGSSVQYSADGQYFKIPKGGNIELNGLNSFNKTIAGNETLDAENQILTLSENLEATLDKLKFQNDTAELITELQMLVALLSTEVLLVHKSKYADIATKIESFKVT